MSDSKKRGKAKTESRNKQSSETSGSSDNSSYSSGSRIDRSGKYKDSTSFSEGLTSSAFTGASGGSSNDKRRFKQTSSNFTETSTLQSGPSGSIKSERGQTKNMSVSRQGKTESVFAADVPGPRFNKIGTDTSDPATGALSSDQRAGTAYSNDSQQSRPKEKIRLMPFKVKGVMNMIKDNPEYKDKSPVMIKVKENDIDQILEGKKVIRGKAEPLDGYFHPAVPDDSVPESTNLRMEGESFRMSTGAESGRSKFSRESRQRAEKPYEDVPPFAGTDRTQKIFAMPEVQAYPVVSTEPRRQRRRHRHRRTPSRRRVVSRSRSRPRSRSVHVRGPPRPRRVYRRPYRRQYISPCTPFPLCEDECPIFRRGYYRRRVNRPYPVPSRPRSVVSHYNRPYYAEDRAPRIVESRLYNTPFTASNRGLYYPDGFGSRMIRPVRSGSRRTILPSPRGKCCCNMAEGKLQFIQPGLCSKRKTVWTNEYAVIPAPEVHLIDPCEELDPSIYPRADNPCIRDGQGNPLTDCIGRPLRSPIGKRFLNFSANGSVMETNIRGNFWTGQPPLCVKCPMPSNSCGQDTTHNWWMSCGYPIMPNMNPFYKSVLAAEMGPC